MTIVRIRVLEQSQSVQVHPFVTLRQTRPRTAMLGTFQSYKAAEAFVYDRYEKLYRGVRDTFCWTLIEEYYDPRFPNNVFATRGDWQR